MSRRVRFGTWNILGLRGFRAEAAAAEIGPPGSDGSLARWREAFDQLDCDALVLQEGVAHDWMLRIARDGGWQLATIPTPHAWSGHVLSRHPILESRVFSHATPTTTGNDPFSRCLGAARLDVADLGATWLVDLHTNPSLPDVPEAEARARRAVEADVLVDHLLSLGAGDASAAIVVGGDFNSDIDEAIHARLRELGFSNAMVMVGGGIVPTFGKHGERPDHVYALDHLYVSAALTPRLASAHVVREPGFWSPGPEPTGTWDLSDHLPVVAEIGLD